MGTYDVVHSAEFYDEGIHVFRVKVVNSSYVGIGEIYELHKCNLLGIVDEAMTTYNQEFHNKPGRNFSEILIDRLLCILYEWSRL